MAYRFNPPPAITTLEALVQWTVQELQRIEADAQETVALDLRPVFAEPLRPREGMIVFADGTEWDPGAGKGVYSYIEGAWVKL